MRWWQITELYYLTVGQIKKLVSYKVLKYWIEINLERSAKKVTLILCFLNNF